MVAEESKSHPEGGDERFCGISVATGNQVSMVSEAYNAVLEIPSEHSARKNGYFFAEAFGARKEIE